MDEYLRLENARQTCFVRCRKEKPKIPSDYFSEEELSFFHGVIQRATCIRRCEEDLAGLQPTGGIPHSIQKDFQKREGYNYLQMSLYQVRGVQVVLYMYMLVHMHVHVHAHVLYMFSRQGP